jgi:hypothetical protein
MRLVLVSKSISNQVLSLGDDCFVNLLLSIAAIPFSLVSSISYTSILRKGDSQCGEDALSPIEYIEAPILGSSDY